VHENLKTGARLREARLSLIRINILQPCSSTEAFATVSISMLDIVADYPQIGKECFTYRQAAKTGKGSYLLGPSGYAFSVSQPDKTELIPC